MLPLQNIPKPSHPRTAIGRRNAPWAARLEGWQAGLLVIIFALVAVVISVPHPVLPVDLPRPVVHHRLVAEAIAFDDSLAAQASASPLDYDVRSLGEAIRSFGLADASADPDTLASASSQISQRLALALPKGDTALLQLRAYQLHLFLSELQHFESSGEESPALRELAGGFVSTIRNAGWLIEDKSQRHFIADNAVRRALFKRRWIELTGLRRAPFSMSLDEDRLLYSFFLDHPVSRSASAASSLDRASCRAMDEYRLKKVNELASVDPQYPGGYAAGMLLLRLGRTKEAVSPLSAYVESHADGPYAIRARNSLRFAHERLTSSSSP